MRFLILILLTAQVASLVHAEQFKKVRYDPEKVKKVLPFPDSAPDFVVKVQNHINGKYCDGLYIDKHLITTSGCLFGPEWKLSTPVNITVFTRDGPVGLSIPGIDAFSHRYTSRLGRRNHLIDVLQLQDKFVYQGKLPEDEKAVRVHSYRRAGSNEMHGLINSKTAKRIPFEESFDSIGYYFFQKQKIGHVPVKAAFIYPKSGLKLALHSKTKHTFTTSGADSTKPPVGAAVFAGNWGKSGARIIGIVVDSIRKPDGYYPILHMFDEYDRIFINGIRNGERP